MEGFECLEGMDEERWARLPRFQRRARHEIPRIVRGDYDFEFEVQDELVGYAWDLSNERYLYTCCNFCSDSDRHVFDHICEAMALAMENKRLKLPTKDPQSRSQGPRYIVRIL